MRITDKAAESSLPVPKGLTPSLIGKVVVVNVFKKNEDGILPDILTKQVGVLKYYALAENGLDFLLDGNKVFTVFYKKAHVEFILYEGS